jgi:multiple sugar transport system substrate-binding protein
MHLVRALRATLVALALACGITAHATELTFRFNDPDVTQIRAALDVFEQQNPGIHVKLEQMGWGDAMSQFLREAAVGTGPDVLHVAFVWPKDMGAAGALLPLDKYMAASGGSGDYIAMDLATGRDGHVYAVPWTVDCWTMVYRTDLLQQAGITTFPKTWQELRATSLKIHQVTGKTGFGFPAGSAASNGIWFLVNYYWWNHGKPLVVNKPGGGFSAGLDQTDIAGAIRYFDDYFKQGDTPRSMLSVSNWGDPAIIEAMASGQQAIGIMPPANFKQIAAAWRARNPNGGDPPLTTAEVPTELATSVVNVGGRSLAINANTKDPDAAWKLVQFLESKPIFTDFYTSQLPARKSVLSTLKFPPGMQGYAQQLATARSWGPYADGPIPINTMWNATGRAFGSAFIGELSVDQASEQLLSVITKGLQ